MLIEPQPDLWTEKYSKEIYERIGHPKASEGCRPAVGAGVLQCPRKIVRAGRCILHAPKLMIAEKERLSADQFSEERTYEEQFREELLKTVQIGVQKGSGWLEFEGVHFPDMPWNQPPWFELLARHGANFTMSVFHQPTNFSGVRFGSITHFQKTVFRDQVNFGCAVAEDKCSFRESVFEADVNFNGLWVRAPVTFWRTRFLAKARFDWLRLNSQLWFNGDCYDRVFYDEVDFSRGQLLSGGEMVLESVDLGRASFLYTDLESVRFRGVTWGQTKAKVPLRILHRRVLWDEKRLKAAEATPELHEAVAQNYREMVLNSERKRDFDLAEDFHIGEMEVRRLLRGAEHKNRGVRVVRQWLNAFGVYRLLSAYGCGYWNAFFVLAALVFTVAALFMFAGVAPTDAIRAVSAEPIRYRLGFGGTPVSLPRVANDYGACIVHTLTLLTFQRDRAFTPVSAMGYMLQSLATVLLAGQGAMVLLAIRRSFKR